MKRDIFFLVMTVVTILILMPEVQAKESQSMDQKEKLIFDFVNTKEIEYWRTVNDGVMGGLSKSEIILSKNNTAIFRGIVSLANNGGFASVRTEPRSYELDGYHGILLRVKGDGKDFQFS